MRAEYDDLATLLEMQQLDLAVMQAKKKRAELPQRIKVMMLRKKRDEIQGKLDQVLELQKKAEVELTALEDDDRALAEKQARAQELIDAAGSDYRKVESHSREMAGAAKRREDLAVKIADVHSHLEKVNGVRSQLEGAIAASEAEEARLRSSFEAEDNSLVELAKSSMTKRAQLAATLPQDLLALYEKTAKLSGGVAIGRLIDDCCGVCRSPIEAGHLIDLKASAPLGTCPNCKRLLIVE